jgi:hypothetical protein
MNNHRSKIANIRGVDAAHNSNPDRMNIHLCRNSLIRTAYATVLVSSTFKHNTQRVQFLTGNPDCVEVVPCGVYLTRDLPAQV